MTTVEQSEHQVSQRSEPRLASFRAWCSELGAASRDRQFEADASAGRLDALADAALAVDVPDGIIWFWIGSHADYDRLVA